MALYAIGDLHLAFQVDKSMDIWGGVWVNHEEKIKRNCARLIKPEDTLVLVGDHTWGRDLGECERDFEFIEALPGRKILVRGNHDMFWDAKKTARLNERFAGKLEFLQDNFYAYGDYALVGTKGFTYEGFGTIDHANKLTKRELVRLEKSFSAAREAGFDRFIMFLHYPPTNLWETRNGLESGFTRMAEKYGAEQVIYAHCHGETRFHDSYRGNFRGIRYSLVSGDCLDFVPMKVLP